MICFGEKSGTYDANNYIDLKKKFYFKSKLLQLLERSGVSGSRSGGNIDLNLQHSSYYPILPFVFILRLIIKNKLNPISIIKN